MQGATRDRAPVTEKVTVGTKARPAGPRRADGLNWAALAACESGGPPARSTRPALPGLYQFSVRTWHAVGGTGHPTAGLGRGAAARAQILYARSGAGQWPHCGSHL